MHEKILGIDIGDRAISIVLMTVGKMERRVEAAVQISLSDRNLWQCLSEAMAALQEKTDISGADSVVSIPDHYVSYRTLYLPFSDRKKIDKVIRFELEPLLPFPMTDVIIDYYVSAAATADNAQTAVLAAAVLKSVLKEYLEGLAAIGVKPDLVVPRGYATAAVLAKVAPFALVAEKYDDKAYFSFISNNCVQFTRAVNLTRQPDRLISDFCAKLRHVVLAYEETYRRDLASPPVFVIGPDWRDQEFTGAIENLLGTSVKQVEVATEAGVTENGWKDGFRRDQVDEQTQMALSLALLKKSRRPCLNFRQAEFALSGKWRQYSGLLVKSGLMVLLAMMLGLSGMLYERQRIQEQIVSLDLRMVDLFKQYCPHIPEIVDPLLQLRAELQRIKKNGKGWPADMAGKAYVIDILNDISRLVPPDTDVVVTRLVAGPEEVMVTGNTDAFNAVDTIKNRLVESEFFGKVDISSATMNRLDQRVHFNMRIILL